MRRKHGPTPEEVRARVLRRDGRCVASIIDPDAGPCRDQFGRPTTELEVDHIRPEIGSTTASAERWMVAACAWHHRATIAGRNWATSHRPEIRAYLSALYGGTNG